MNFYTPLHREHCIVAWQNEFPPGFDVRKKRGEGEWGENEIAATSNFNTMLHFFELKVTIGG